MIKNIEVDPFYDRQPPLLFVDDLKKPVHTCKMPVWNAREADDDEVFFRGCTLDFSFKDEDGLLDTAYADFENFCRVNDITDGDFVIRTEYRETADFEDHEICVTDEGCTIYASDTEGIRRGLVYVEDEMLSRSGSFLKKGSVRRHAYIKDRISRCFYSPINRPPKDIDELANDIDYYPDEYLNRLAHDGTNGVWIYTKFCDLLPSSYITEYGKDSRRRLDKLNRTIEKCRKYGIGVFVFAIDPSHFESDEMIKKYSGVLGGRIWDKYSFCTNTDFGEAYCEEATRTLFTRCPDLAGLIIITCGERVTTCASHSAVITCPRCKEKKAGEVLSQSVEALQMGVRNSGAKGKFISWTYGHRFWSNDDIRDYVKSAPCDVMLLQNFEEMGYADQLGKERLALDYWLSYAGPSQMFEATADEAMRSGKHMYAKIQACNSHEVGTVPYVPAPGILFDKYKAMRRWNVEGVLQCWYFGNFPSVMNKAAGELAFCADFSDKDAFLTRLAAIYFGRDKAKNVKAAYDKFGEGYSKYPVNIMFSYFGPMHDGPVWELQLKPKNFSLPRSWKNLDPANGDRICESLLNGHTTEEAITLCGAMADAWREGIRLLPCECGYYPADEQLSVAKALDVLFHSGLNIVRFYDLRDKLGTCDGDAASILDEMRRIVLDEIGHSRELCELWKKDNRLGYHSEAEGFKFFPEKLDARVKSLEKLLSSEFAEVEERIKNGMIPLEYYAGIEQDSVSYKLAKGDIANAEWAEFDREGSGFRASIDGDEIVMQIRDSQKGVFRISTEFRLVHPDVPVCINSDGNVSITFEDSIYYQALGKEKERLEGRWKVDVSNADGSFITARVKIDDVRCGRRIGPMKIRIVCPSGASMNGHHKGALGKSDLCPEDFFWLIP